MAVEAKRTAADDLPPDMWSEILNRVPNKSILPCRSVCKSWYSLVSYFISDYYSTRNINKNGNRVLVQLYDKRADVCSFSSYDESFAESRVHDEVPEAFLGSNVQIVGSCNGLICLSKYGHGDSEVTFLIWNPTIRKVVEVPSRTITSQNFSYFGFGFDSKTNDHKVLCMCTDSSGDFSDVVANVCEIYDLRKGVWRGISPLVHPWKVGRPTSECYLDGALHWTGYRHGMSTERILLSFNMSDEIFREIRMPGCAEFAGYDGDEDEGYIQTRSVAFGGLIHVIMWDAYCRVDCSVWAMKEYGVIESWTKLFSLSADGYPLPQPFTFRLWKKDEVLMVHDWYNVVYEDLGDYEDYEDLVLYNSRSRTSKLLLSFDKHISNVCLYEESLFLM